MNNPLLIAVSAYAGDAIQVENNMPLYQQHGAPVLILSPTDAPITALTSNPQGVYYYQEGQAEWAGPKSLERHKAFLRHLLSLPYDWFLFHDADSICLRPELPSYLFENPNVHFSNEVADLNPGASALPKLAMQPPYTFSRAVLVRLVEVLDRPAMSYYVPVKEEHMPVPTHCIDHLQLQLVYAAGIAHRSYPDGASFETRSPVGLAAMQDQVANHGKVFLHSVKDAGTLAVLQDARRIYLSKHP